MIIPAHTEERWESLVTAVSLIQRQTTPPQQIVVAVDHNPKLLRRVKAEIPSIEATANRYDNGASGTRNSGAELAVTPLLAFLDSDVRPRRDWLETLIAPFADPAVIGTGGFVAPDWINGRPAWFPDEFLWVVGATFRATDAPLTPVRNVWSENMAVRQHAFSRVGGFRIAFGKVGDRSSPEDTDFCLRVGHAYPGQKWVLVVDAVVDHTVGPERSTLPFFLRRCYSEGSSKVTMARLNSGARELGDEYSYLRRLVTTSTWSYLRLAASGRSRAAGGRVLAVLGGLIAATLGAAVAFVTGFRPGR